MTENFSAFSRHEKDPKESVCIDAFRIYDSCADKDCCQNLRVFFGESGQNVIDQADSVRVKDVNVITTFIDLEEIPFQRGFFTVDITFFFEVNLEVFISPSVVPVSVCGISIFKKKTVLYGSEGNVKIFSSDFVNNDTDLQLTQSNNLPKCTVQVATPVTLDAKLCVPGGNSCQTANRIPDCICRRFGGEFILNDDVEKIVTMTIGLFSIVQIERNVQLRIPAYEFCVPKKECTESSESPCDLFSRIAFPTDEFYPPNL